MIEATIDKRFVVVVRELIELPCPRAGAARLSIGVESWLIRNPGARPQQAAPEWTAARGGDRPVGSRSDQVAADLPRARRMATAPATTMASSTRPVGV